MLATLATFVALVFIGDGGEIPGLGLRNGPLELPMLCSV